VERKKKDPIAFKGNSRGKKKKKSQGERPGEEKDPTEKTKNFRGVRRREFVP